MEIRSLTTVPREDRSLIDLPVEMIYRIFDFCDVQTILHNVRQVCRTLYVHSNTYNRYSLILNRENKETMKKISRLISPQSVVSLQIIHDAYFSGTVADFFLSIFNNCSFPRLQSLTVKWPEKGGLEDLLQSLSPQSLIALSVYYIRYSADQWNDILNALIQYHIEKLSIQNCDHSSKDSSWPLTNTLTYLHLNFCTYTEHLHILHQSPQLRTFVIDQCSMDYEIMCLSLPTLTSSFLLKSLIISQWCFTSEYFDLFISHLPSLRDLKLTSSRDQLDALFDGFFWEELISSKLPQLKHLQLLIFFDCRRSHVYTSLQSMIEPFRRPFWLVEKRWFVTCAYNPDQHSIILCTIHREIYGPEKCFVCEISSTDDQCRLTQGTNGQVPHTNDDKVRGKEFIIIDIFTKSKQNSRLECEPREKEILCMK